MRFCQLKVRRDFVWVVVTSVVMCFYIKSILKRYLFANVVLTMFCCSLRPILTRHLLYIILLRSLLLFGKGFQNTVHIKMDIFKFRETYGSPIKVEDFDSELEQSPPLPSEYPSLDEDEEEVMINSPGSDVLTTSAGTPPEKQIT